ncbi:DUF4272 domain-containing protein [Undibacterium sp. Rencai35W]|uniref:DUF4272 domain-containing protein n=1 Tax=Undibacterium sp. Rencai35W TaxID=3413046 RepID=UPI003BF24DE3
MNPENRKFLSETMLHKRGIRINLQLPLIESDEEVTLRDTTSLFERLVALWAVTSSAQSGEASYFREYLASHQMTGYLSEKEKSFLLSDQWTEDERNYFSVQKERLFLLAWCAGIQPDIELSLQASNLDKLLRYFPRGMESPDVLRQAINTRSKSKILDWADLLYRVHWAVRHANLIGKTTVGNIRCDIIPEWHHAVNWITCYNEEDNWDMVETDT